MKPKISLIVPVFNESNHLADFLTKIDPLDLGIEKELIFVDDYSTDQTASILRAFTFKSQTQVLYKQKNEGKGAAIQNGIEKATGDFIGIQDADFEYDMSELSTLIQPLLDDKADIVFGSRFKKSSPQVHRTFHYLGNRVLTLMSNLTSGLYLTDMETCYKIFKQEIIKNVVLETHRFGFEPEITAKIAKLKCRIHEIPISYYPRNYLEGKKISWKDGVAAFFHIIRFNLFRSVQQAFKATLPAKYIPRGRQWL